MDYFSLRYLIWAVTLGGLSALSLPLGSAVGLLTSPKPQIISVLQAFGAGALIAALSVELVAPTVFALGEHSGAAHHGDRRARRRHRPERGVGRLPVRDRKRNHQPGQPHRSLGDDDLQPRRQHRALPIRRRLRAPVLDVLHGSHDARDGEHRRRRLLAGALSRALAAAAHLEVKAFLIHCLQLAGGRESIPELSKCLADPRLGRPAPEGPKPGEGAFGKGSSRAG